MHQSTNGVGTLDSEQRCEAGQQAPAGVELGVRVYDARAATVDVRTGLSTRGWPSAAELQRFLWATLTLADGAE